jgi:nitroimidazol reductase NimA-like FMN-containing flavoprotein (pyridoxamine 5'-phosphate oxidase superfamily)
MMDAEDPVEEMTVDECWELLEAEEFGRLAFRLVDEVHLVPMNYVVDARAMLFRTTAGNKLLSAALHSNVAFEIDWYGDDSAWSVVARGRIRRLADRELHRLAELPGHSWLPTEKREAIELIPDVVTGRRFFLQRT